MTRAKVKIEYIQNDLNRRTSFNKRKKGLLKKVDELSILCGIDACAIVFGQCDCEPEVWPSRTGVQRVLAKFRNMPDFQQASKMENQESFTRDRIKKAQEKLRKLKQENQENEMTLMMFKFLAGEGSSDDISMSDLNQVRSLASERIKDIALRIEILKEERESQARAMALTNGMNTSIATDDQNGANAMENYMWNSLLQALNSPIQDASFIYP